MVDVIIAPNASGISGRLSWKVIWMKRLKATSKQPVDCIEREPCDTVW